MIIIIQGAEVYWKILIVQGIDSSNLNCIKEENNIVKPQNWMDEGELN